MPDWPADLPQELEIRGFRDALPDRLRRSNVPGAVALTELPPERTEAAALRGQVLLSGAEWARLLRFYRTDLAGGALDFRFPDPDGGAAIDVTFASPPGLSSVGADLYAVTLSLDRL